MTCVKSEELVVDANPLPYCSLDGKSLSLGEKENLFLDALQAYYYGEESIMSNEEFGKGDGEGALKAECVCVCIYGVWFGFGSGAADNLKEDLIWGGSSVVVLSPLEQRFLEAVRSFNEGKPVLTDQEYDALKTELMKQNSPVTLRGPRCSLRSRQVSEGVSE